MIRIAYHRIYYIHRHMLDHMLTLKKSGEEYLMSLRKATHGGF